jgi:hypothetical protein
MKVFISSVIKGFELFRDAAAESVTTLDHELLRSEDFGATDVSSQVTCLSAVRAADVTLVFIGARYGDIQESGLSATHEEFREACEHGRALVFEQQGVEREPKQDEFLREAQKWASGVGTTPFESPEDLERAVTQALVRLERRDAAGGIDTAGMHARAVAEAKAGGSATGPLLHLAVAGGPEQTMLRPSEVNSDLLAYLKAEALTGANAVLDTRRATEDEIRGADSLHLVQDNGASVVLDALGTVRVSTPGLMQYNDPLHRHSLGIAEDHVAKALMQDISLVSAALDHIDPSQRLSHLCVVAALSGASYLGWSESGRSDVVSVSIMSRSDPLVVPEQPYDIPRPALRAEADRIVRDLVALLRAEFEGP